MDGTRIRWTRFAHTTRLYEPFARIVNEERVSLQRLVVFHMDECLDWEGKELSRSHPYSFRGQMERRFYNSVDADLRVPETNRIWLNPSTMESVRERIWSAPIDLVYGGWGQDGHVAYNQARRNPFSRSPSMSCARPRFAFRKIILTRSLPWRSGRSAQPINSYRQCRLRWE